MKTELGETNFAEFGLLTEDQILIVGRVINNLNEDINDRKLGEFDIALINTGVNESNEYKLKLNLQALPQFSLLEGEIIAA